MKNMNEYIEEQKVNIEEKQKKACANVRDWYEFSSKPRTEDEIRKRIQHDNETGKNTCCLSYICTFSILSEEFIEELIELTKVKIIGSKKYGDKLDWTAISSKQKLSEEFIEKHADKVNWRAIFSSQELSDEFKQKHLKDFEYR